MEPEGIAAIYPYTGYFGEVDVYVKSATEADGIPTTAQLEAVYDSIQLDSSGLATRRPANAYVNVYPIARVNFSVEVSGITGVANLATTEAAIEAALEQYFDQAQPFIAGYSLGVNRSTVSATAVTSIVSVIVGADGGVFTGATLKLGGTPIIVYALPEGRLAGLSSVSFFV
jgi:hypothetical protein